MPNHPQQGRADEADRRALLELLEKEAVMLGLPPHLVEKYVATQLRVRRLRPANQGQGAADMSLWLALGVLWLALAVLALVVSSSGSSAKLAG